MDTRREKLEALKKEKNAVIMAHYYVPDEVQEIADYIGDSYYLSDMATKVDASVIVLCGVRFMGESAKILNPGKKVLLPDLHADCPMAHMAAIEKIEEVRKEYPDVAVVCYVNSTAELKSHSDVCVTSSNAVKIVKELPNHDIFFIPDEHLGTYVAEQVPEKHIILNDGFCHVHAAIRPEAAKAAKEARPQAKLLVHPECRSEVVALADYVGSTAGIIKYAEASKEKYDVVIVGTGVAGCFAALHLPQEADILMITKADTEDSDSFLAQGGICVLKNEDDYDAFYEDTMHAGHYENTPESVDIMIRSSRNVINQLIAWGVDFRRDENGELCYTKEGAHSTNRILFHDDVTGKEITSKLLAQVKKLPNVTLLAHTEMCDILSCKNVCEGVLIRDEEGKLIPVYARDVIWACGGIGGIYDNSTNFPHLTGDALAIAIHRNVALKNVNYVQIHPTTLYSQKKGRRFLISESVRGEGAVLLDKNGERFTNELQPRDVVSREIHRQMEKDHTKHVWLSLKTIPLDVKERFPNIYQKCLEEGYDITKEPIPVVPAQHYFMGGVKVDSNSETTMDHLYAAGETSCNGVHGANRLASNSLLESLVFAERAAKKMAAEWAAEGLTENADRKETATEPKEDEWKLLAKRYDIRKEDYQNMEEYAERCKESIWDAIRKEDEYESNHKNTKCG